ncbi:hypothetical protein [uncultured Phocaeicola sp.]|jgi:hypothetical protein|uniref:hypothetical protein n=1 Tax=uncultured Phocaeicola sp. TaxID=990718 RepID=UPI00258BBCEB|nr:hypothetical protein [uncultured Phocaeicola sp.]
MRPIYKLDDKQAEQLVENIQAAVQKRITEDNYIEDTYLRINHEDLSVEVIYLEESNLTYPNDDIALLNLMYDQGGENWIPEEIAIRCLVNERYC